MKAKDLRLGNLVTIDNELLWSELKGKVMVVTEIEKIKETIALINFPLSKHYITVEDEGGTEYFQSNEFIKPIPITMEWIRKLGFIFEDIGNDANLTEQLYRKASIGGGSTEFKIEFDTRNETFTLDFITGSLINYAYVHQLQNLYYLHRGLELPESIEVDTF